MAKIDQKQVQGGRAARVRGQFYTRIVRDQVIVSKWPKKRSGPKTPAQRYQEAEFSMAARMTNNAGSDDYQAAIVLADGVPMVPRDFLMMSRYGTLIQFFFEDGTPWTRYRDVTINAQLVLDQVTDELGSVIWRAPVGWIGVPTPPVPSFLASIDNVVDWVPVPSSGSGGAAGNLLGLLSPAGTNQVVQSSYGGIPAILDTGTTINAICTWANAASPTTQLAAVIYARNGLVPGARLALGAQHTGVVQGINVVPLNTPWVAPADDLYFIGLHTATANWVQANTLSGVASWQAGSAYPPPNPAGTASQGFGATLPKVWFK